MIKTYKVTISYNYEKVYGESMLKAAQQVFDTDPDHKLKDSWSMKVTEVKEKGKK